MWMSQPKWQSELLRTQDASARASASMVFMRWLIFARIGDGLYSVRLQDTASSKRIDADARALFLPDDQIDLLLASVKTGTALSVCVNAWFHGETITGAEIIRVDAVG
jgi:hypothetical protein